MKKYCYSYIKFKEKFAKEINEKYIKMKKEEFIRCLKK